MTRLNETDQRILRALDDDPRATASELAATLGLARGTVHVHLRRLLSSSGLRPFSATIKPGIVGYPLRAMVTARISQGRSTETIRHLRTIKQVIECVAVTGTDDIFIQIVARDTDHLYELGQELLLAPGIARTSTAVVLHEHIEHRIAQLL